MAFKNPNDLANQLVQEGMKPGTPVNAPSHAVWVEGDDGNWKMYSGHDGTENFDRFSPRYANYKNAVLTKNGEDVETTFKNMDDFDLFNAIHFVPSNYGRDNYVEGEQEQMWNELNKYFDLPKYNPYMYSFGSNKDARTVNLFRNGVYDTVNKSGWLRKPMDLGPLKRRM